MSENNSETNPLHTMNPLNRFSDRVRDYVKYRPSYPDEAIDIILNGQLPSEVVAADIGAGTGISSRLLADRGVRVIAIEPNEEMRQAAAPHPLVEFRPGTAEATNLPEASVDLVSCFQAFHWFNPEPTLAEFHRILKPSGRLAVVWNDRDRNDELTSEYSRLVRIASNDHPAEKRLVSADPLFTTGHFSNVRQHTFPYWQELNLSGLIGRAESASYVPRSGSAHEELISGLQQLYDRFCDSRGTINLVYHTEVYIAQKRSY